MKGCPFPFLLCATSFLTTQLMKTVRSDPAHGEKADNQVYFGSLCSSSSSKPCWSRVKSALSRYSSYSNGLLICNSKLISNKMVLKSNLLSVVTTQLWNCLLCIFSLCPCILDTWIIKESVAAIWYLSSSCVAPFPFRFVSSYLPTFTVVSVFKVASYGIVTYILCCPTFQVDLSFPFG